MAVTEETPIASSIANGVTTLFPHLFTVLDASDLVVQGTVGGVTTAYTLGVDYSVNGVGTPSGSVQFVSPPASGVIVTRYRDTSLARETDYQSNGDFEAAVVNRDFDRLWLAFQDVFRGGKSVPNTIRVPNGETVPALPAATSRAGYYLGFDGAGNPSLLLAASGTAAALASDLSSTSDPLKGDAMIGWVRTASGAVPATLHTYLERATVKLTDFLSSTKIADALSGASPPEVSTEIAAALASMPGGGVLEIPHDMKMRVTSSVALHSGITIRGGSNVDPYFGIKNGNEAPTFIYSDAASTPIFTIGPGVCDVVVEGLCLAGTGSPVAYTAPVAGKYGIEMEGDRPNSSYRITLRNVTFYAFERAISVVGVDTGSGVDWQIDSVLVERCTFFNNTHGVYFNTLNADAWKFQNCVFVMWTNGRAVYSERSGYIEFDTCYSVPAETSASVFATGSGFVQLGDFPDNVRMVNCQSESQDYFLQVDTSTGFENVYNQIQLIGCIVESPIAIQRQCKVVSIASRYTEDVTCAGDDVEAHSIADSWLPTTKKFVMSGLRPRLFVSPGSTQTSGSVANVVTATPTTMFSLPASAGMYNVYINLPNSGAAYVAHAQLACDGTTLIRMGGDNGANLTITVSGRNVQCTQSSGVNQTVFFKYSRVA